MLFIDVLNFFEPLNLRDEIKNLTFDLIKDNGIYHSIKSKRSWFWLDPERYGECNEITSEEGQYILDFDAQLCEKCIREENFIYSAVADNPAITEMINVLYAFSDLSRLPLTCDKDSIAEKGINISYYCQLAYEFDKAVNEAEEDSMQSYFILDNYDKKIANTLIERHHKSFENIHKDTLSTERVKAMVKSTIQKIEGFETLNEEEIYVVVAPHRCNSSQIFESIENLEKVDDVPLVDLPWLTLAIFNYSSTRGVSLTKLPTWVYQLLLRFSPDAIQSKPYSISEISDEIMQVVNALWKPWSEEIYSSFDKCFEAAVKV